MSDEGETNSKTTVSCLETTPTSRFHFPRGEVLVTSVLLQNFGRGSLSAVTTTTNCKSLSQDDNPNKNESPSSWEVLQEVIRQVFNTSTTSTTTTHATVLPAAGRRRHDAVRLQFTVDGGAGGVEMGRLQVLVEDFKTSLRQSSDTKLANRANFVEWVPETLVLATLQPPKPGPLLLSSGSPSSPSALNSSSCKTMMSEVVVVVVDTDVISHFLKGPPSDPQTRRFQKQEAIARWLLSHDSDDDDDKDNSETKNYTFRKVISWQTQAELDAWIMLRSFKEERLLHLERILASFEVVSGPDRGTSLIWANLMNYCRAQGRPAAAQDLWVAATAIRLGAHLCTFNVKDYDYLPGLQIVDLATFAPTLADEKDESSNHNEEDSKVERPVEKEEESTAQEQDETEEAELPINKIPQEPFP